MTDSGVSAISLIGADEVHTAKLFYSHTKTGEVDRFHVIVAQACGKLRLVGRWQCETRIEMRKCDQRGATRHERQAIVGFKRTLE